MNMYGNVCVSSSAFLYAVSLNTCHIQKYSRDNIDPECLRKSTFYVKYMLFVRNLIKFGLNFKKCKFGFTLGRQEPK
jgi:hypothetical protein